MKIKQLSVFLENKAGRLSGPCHVLGKAGVNILTLSLADTQEFGILRLIVKDWQRARAVLEQGGCVVKVTEVLAIEVADRPGGGAEVLEVLERANINVQYMYAFTFRRGDKAVLVFRFDDADTAIGVLQDKGINVLKSVELYDLTEDLH